MTHRMLLGVGLEILRGSEPASGSQRLGYAASQCIAVARWDQTPEAAVIQDLVGAGFAVRRHDGGTNRKCLDEHARKTFPLRREHRRVGGSDVRRQAFGTIPVTATSVSTPDAGTCEDGVGQGSVSDEQQRGLVALTHLSEGVHGKDGILFGGETPRTKRGRADGGAPSTKDAGVAGTPPPRNTAEITGFLITCRFLIPRGASRATSRATPSETATTASAGVDT